MTPEAFEVAYTLHRPYMLILATRLVSRQVAEDIFHASVIRLLEHLEKLPDNPEEAKPYFITSLFSVGLDYLRHESRERQLFVEASDLPEDMSPEEVFADSRPVLATSVPFLRAFRGVKMSPSRWRIVEAYYIRGLPLAEAAQEVGVDPRTARKTLFEATAILRQKLKDWAPQ